MPTVPQTITAAPRLNQYLVYASDTWSMTPHFSLMGSLRYIGQHSQTSTNAIYGDGAIDPHIALGYTFAGLNGFRANFDHTSTPPLPLEVQRSSSGEEVPQPSARTGDRRHLRALVRARRAR